MNAGKRIVQCFNLESTNHLRVHMTSGRVHTLARVEEQCQTTSSDPHHPGPPWLMSPEGEHKVPTPSGKVSWQGSSPSVMSAWRGSSPSTRGAWRLLKKYRKSRRKHLKREEYKRLRSMVPAIATKHRVSKVQVIEETIKYIDELHSALIARFKTVGLPSSLQGFPIDVTHIDPSQIKELVRQVLPAPSSILCRRERIKRLPSFLEKAARRRSRRLE